VNINGDRIRLIKDYDTTIRSYLDLADFAEEVYGTKTPRSLDGLFQHVTSLTLPKDRKITRSNWERALTSAQRIYAANDAYASFLIFHYLMHLNPSASPKKFLKGADNLKYGFLPPLSSPFSPFFWYSLITTLLILTGASQVSGLIDHLGNPWTKTIDKETLGVYQLFLDSISIKKIAKIQGTTPGYTEKYLIKVKSSLPFPSLPFPPSSFSSLQCFPREVSWWEGCSPELGALWSTTLLNGTVKEKFGLPLKSPRKTSG